MQVIKIVFSHSIWLDITNNIAIGDRADLVEYVNKLQLIVSNDNCFDDASLFWYRATPYAWTAVLIEINEAYRTATVDKWKLPYIAITSEYITTHFLNPTSYERESEANNIERMGWLPALKQACLTAFDNRQDVAVRVKKKRQPNKISFIRTATKI